MLRVGYPTNPSFIAENTWDSPNRTPPPIPWVQGAVSSEVDRSGSVLQLILNNVGIFTDKIVSEMGLRHGKKRKNGLRANGLYSFMKSGDLLIVQLIALKMGMNN